MIYLTDDLNFALSLIDGTSLLRSHKIDVSQVIKLLENYEYKSCIMRQFSKKKIKELLGRNIPMYQEDPFNQLRIKDEDIIIHFQTEILFKNNEVLTKEAIQQKLFKFSIVKIVTVLDEYEIKYCH